MGGLSVLVVDDQPLNRLILGKLLNSLDLHVIEAADGQAGLEAYLKHGRSLSFVFMDIMMPVCDGIQAALSIRSAEVRQGWVPVPIVAFTSEDVAHGSPLWQRCMRSGFNDVVPKPVNKLFATQLLCRFMPGLRRPSPSDETHASSSDASWGDELVCACGAGPAATGCATCGSTARSTAHRPPSDLTSSRHEGSPRRSGAFC